MSKPSAKEQPELDFEPKKRTSPKAEVNGSRCFVVTHSYAVVRMMTSGLLSAPPLRSNEPGIRKSVLTPIPRQEVPQAVSRIKTKRTHIPLVVELHDWAPRNKLSSAPFAYIKQIIARDKSELREAFAEISKEVRDELIHVSEDPSLFEVSNDQPKQEMDVETLDLEGEEWNQTEIEIAHRALSISFMLQATRHAVRTMEPHTQESRSLCEFFELINRSALKSEPGCDPIANFTSSIAGLDTETCPISQAMQDWREKIIESAERSPQVIFELLNDFSPSLDEELAKKLQSAFSIARGEKSVSPSRLIDDECPKINTVRAIILIATGNGHDLRKLFNFFKLPPSERPGNEVLLRSIALVAAFSAPLGSDLAAIQRYESRRRVLELTDISLRCSSVCATLSNSAKEQRTLRKSIAEIRKVENDAEFEIKIDYSGDFGPTKSSLVLTACPKISEKELLKREKIASQLAQFKEAVGNLTNQELFSECLMEQSYPHEISITLNTPSTHLVFLKVNATDSHYILECEVPFKTTKKKGVDDLMAFGSKSKCPYHLVLKAPAMKSIVGMRFFQEIPRGTVQIKHAEHWIKSFHTSVIAAIEQFVES